VGIALHPLASMLRELAERYPRLQVDLSVSDQPVDMLAEGFDVAFRIRPHPQDRSLIERRLGTERVVICGAPAYLSRRAPPQVPHDLMHHNCLRMKNSKWTFRMEEDPVVIPVSGTLVVDDIAVLREATLEGVGLARLPRSLVDVDLREGRLRTLLDAYTSDVLGISLVYLQRKHLPHRVRVFIDFMTEHFRKLFRGG
jgi:DNA-binding transcriptional LysR family regulator